MRIFKRWWVVIFLVGAVLFALANLTLNFTGDILYFPTIMTIGAFLVPVTFVAYFYQQEDLYDKGIHVRGILPTLVICAIFGGLIGTLAAGTLESRTLTSFSALSVLWVGPIEEFAKLLVPIALFIILRKRYRTEMDGLLIGVASGMAFAAFETMGYELIALVRSGGSLVVLDQTILIRGLLSPAGHAAWTGLVAATLWRERERTGRPFTLFVLLFFVVAAALHSLWDFTSFASSQSVAIPSYVAIGLVSLFLLFWRLRQARRVSVMEREAAVPSPAQ